MSKEAVNAVYESHEAAETAITSAKIHYFDTSETEKAYKWIRE